MYNMQKFIDSIFQTIGKYFQHISIIFYILYALFVMGFTILNIEYLMIFKTLIHTFICFFLIVRFHPFRQHSISPADSQIVFSAAIILLLNMGIINTIYGYMEKYKIEKQVQTIIELTHSDKE